MGALGAPGAGRGLRAGGSLGPSPESGQKREAELAPNVGRKPYGDSRGPGRGWRQRRRWGTQAPCGRLRAKPALQTQRKEPLVFTQRSLLHSSPRWFSSRHSSMSADAGNRCGRRDGPGATQPQLPVPADSAGPRPPRPGPAPAAQLTDAARAGGVELEAAGTLAHGAAGPRHAAAAHAAALVRIFLRAVLFCGARENTEVNTPPAERRRLRLCPLPLHSPRGGFPSSRGLASQKELLSLCDVGHWDPGKGGGRQRSAASMHPGSRPPYPPSQLLSGRLTGAARRARAALGAPTAALATAAVVEGEGGPSQGTRAHAVLSALAPAHVPPLRGTLCGGGPGIRERPGAGTAIPSPTHPRGGCGPGAPHGGLGPGVGPGRRSPSPAGLSGSWQSRPEGPGTQGGRHSQR